MLPPDGFLTTSGGYTEFGFLIETQGKRRIARPFPEDNFKLISKDMQLDFKVQFATRGITLLVDGKEIE